MSSCLVVFTVGAGIDWTAALGAAAGREPSLAGATGGSTGAVVTGAATAGEDVEIGADAGTAATTTPVVEVELEIPVAMGFSALS